MVDVVDKFMNVECTALDASSQGLLRKEIFSGINRGISSAECSTDLRNP